MGLPRDGNGDDEHLVGGAALLAALTAVTGAALLWSLQLGLSAGAGIHLALPLG